VSRDHAPAPARNTSASVIDAIRLLRPRQWPILSFQLFVGVVCALDWVELIRSAEPWSPWPLALAWVAWVICLNGGTLAFNSAWDRDTTSVAYLEQPPPPPSWLAAASSVLMVLGIVIGLGVSLFFSLVLAGCVILSWAYSHPKVRLKGIPGADLIVNVVGYGFGTTIAGLAAGYATLPHTEFIPANLGFLSGGWWLAVGFGFLFGSFYPMTQIYQMTEDRERGDRTLALALGTRRSLDLSLLLGCMATGAMIQAFIIWERSVLFPVIALAIWLVFVGRWRKCSSTLSAEEHARFLSWSLRFWGLVDLGVLLGWLL
jgi:lycopene elongase/hydratase (dihydrobisanhydrobacterioruberin-forming)